ncbi:uncharacterized protein LOC143463368 isoform X1 [Clavelina lepadiformis]|uniref:uncharacterized protein LOC143463368 isoform X1 n=1 Tax=Clavelina lepadiformis TaxID=159417 RepID=UPI0040418907
MMDEGQQLARFRRKHDALIMTWLVLLVLSLLHSVWSRPSGFTGIQRTKRSEVRTCLESQSICKRNRTCASAFNFVKDKCTMKEGSCNAESKYLVRCANSIDVLREDAFPREPSCKCFGYVVKKRLQKCSDIYNSVYFNPCFDEGVDIRDRITQTTPVTRQPIVAKTTATTVSYKKISTDVTKSPTKKEGNFQSKNATSAPELSESELEELDLFFAENDKTSRHGGSRPKQKDIDDVTVTKATKLGDVLSTPQLVVKETSSNELSTQVVKLSERTLTIFEIVGIALGALVLVLTLIGAIYCCKRKKRRKYAEGKPQKHTSPLISFQKEKKRQKPDTS